MKCFTWIQGAVEVLGNKHNHGKPNDVAEKSDQASIGYTRTSAMKLPQTRNVEPLPTLDLKNQNQSLESMIELRGHLNSSRNSLQPLVSPKDATIFTRNNFHIKKSSKSLGSRRDDTSTPMAKEKHFDCSLACDYNPAVVVYISSGRTQQPKSSQRRDNSSTSTISLTSTTPAKSTKSTTLTTSTLFRKSLLAPVTILVTTPDNDPLPPAVPSPNTELETPRPNTFGSIRAHRLASTNSLHPSLTLHHVIPPPPHLNPTLLMPPLLPPKPTRASRAAISQEYRSIRLFLITFLNTKSAQFPRKLRMQIMEAYSITDADLDPAVVRKYLLLDADENERKDESVVLGCKDMERESSDADALEILDLAFRSQVRLTPDLKRHSGRRESVRGVSEPLNRRVSISGTLPTNHKLKPRRSISNLPTPFSQHPAWAMIEGIDPVAPIEAHIRPSKKHFHHSLSTQSMRNYRSSMDAPSLIDLQQVLLVGKRERDISVELKHGSKPTSIKTRPASNRRSLMAGLSSSLYSALSRPRSDDLRS